MAKTKRDQAHGEFPLFYRHAKLAVATRADGAQGDPEITIALSSDEPIERVDWFGERWVEILEHTPQAVDLSRATNGLPLLLNHSSYEQIGRIDGLRVHDDGVLRGTVRFSKSALGRDVLQDVIDGIRVETSVGYRISERKEEQEKGKILTVRATRWMPMEGSLVAVPADPTVGIGRSLSAPNSERAMSEPKVDTPPVPPPPVPAAAGGQEPGRERQMKDLAALATMHDAVAELPGWIERGLTIEQAKDEILAKHRAGAKPEVPPSTDKGVQLTGREAKEYSLSRAILALADGRRHTLGIEREVSDEIEKRSRDPEVVQARHGAEDRRLYIPHSLPIFAVERSLQARFAHFFQRGALEVATASKGGELKFIEPGPFIELLRNRMLVRQLGAQVLTGLRGDISFPRQITAAAASWVPESPTADVGSSNLTLDSPDLAPRILQATTSYTRKLLAQGVVDVDMLVRDDFVKVHALAIDLAAIAGLGTSNQPTGILNVSGIGSVTIGANGGVPTYDHFVDLETEVAVDNADIGALAYLSTARVRGRMKKSAAISATTGIPAWFGSDVNGYNAQASQQVPSNLTKGTSTTICHAILFGNWADLIIGYWGDLEIIVDPYSQKKRGDIEVTTYQMCDVTVRHAESFAAVKDALP